MKLEITTKEEESVLEAYCPKTLRERNFITKQGELDYDKLFFCVMLELEAIVFKKTDVEDSVALTDLAASVCSQITQRANLEPAY